jgi:hypothetical protein
MYLMHQPQPHGWGLDPAAMGEHAVPTVRDAPRAVRCAKYIHARQTDAAGDEDQIRELTDRAIINFGSARLGRTNEEPPRLLALNFFLTYSSFIKMDTGSLRGRNCV